MLTAHLVFVAAVTLMLATCIGVDRVRYRVRLGFEKAMFLVVLMVGTVVPFVGELLWIGIAVTIIMENRNELAE